MPANIAPVSNALHALMSFYHLLSHVSFNQTCHICLWPFPFNHPEGGILAKPLTATRVQKGLRLPALASTSWSRTSSVLTTTDSLPVDTLFNHVMLENPPKPLTDHDVPNVSVGTADHPCQVGPPEGNRAIGQTPRACRNALVPLRFFSKISVIFTECSPGICSSLLLLSTIFGL